MGIFHSKIAPTNKQTEQLNNFEDPRSPTVNINRSPIITEIATAKPIITKVRDLTADLTEILDNAQTPDRVFVHEKLQSVLDPRSPSLFLRTPLVLDDSNASNVSLRGSSIEYEEIDCEGELSFKDCTATDIATTLSIVERTTDRTESSIFSQNTSLNTELKADIDSIIQKLCDAGSIKDPRSPSIDIQRTPIVFHEDQEPTTNIDEGQSESESKEETTIIEQSPVDQQSQLNDNASIVVSQEEKNTTAKATNTIVQQDENSSTTTPTIMAITPKRGKSELSARKFGTGPRTPLGCVTNVQPLLNSASTVGNDSLRKTALISQLKQSVAINAEMVPVAAKKLQMRSKIPTFRMK